MFDAIDSLYLSAPDLDTACRPYERLGVTPLQATEHVRTLCLGRSPGDVLLHLVARHPFLQEPLRRAVESGRPLFAVGLRVADLLQVQETLAARGLPGSLFREGNIDAVWLPLHEQAGVDLILHQKSDTPSPSPNALPLVRLDHLATVTPDLEDRSRFWADFLGVGVAGEVRTPTLVIRQLKIGDAVLELLGPASADSPIWQRPRGLVSMASWEVGSLDGVVSQARAAGFAVPDPAPGPLPRTRITTIPGTELAGLNMQLLEYV